VGSNLFPASLTRSHRRRPGPTVRPPPARSSSAPTQLHRAQAERQPARSMRCRVSTRDQRFDSCVLVSDLQGNEYPSLINYVHRYMYRSYLFVLIFFVRQSKRIC
jgi:hypothetical protein